MADDQQVDNLGSEKSDPRPKGQLRGTARFLLVILIASAAGFGGGFLANNKNASTNNEAVQKAVTEEGDLITQIAEDVGQSVVSVNVTSSGRQQTLFGTVPVERESAGTGFILSEDGVVVTNRHVVPKNAENISVTLSDGTELGDITVIGRTAESDVLDIAFLKIDDIKGKDLHPAKLGDSTRVDVGQRVVAIGNALGQFQNTVTSGIISGYGRNVTAQDDRGVDTLQNLFQTDASINQGNSGGPLVNLAGEVIGINTAVAAGEAENIGFAIPISDVQGLIKSVLEKGELLRPFLGIRYISLTDDIAYKLNLNTTRGAYIAPQDGQDPVMKGSPADKAGLQEKDIVIRVNDIPIDEKNSLASVLGRFSVGDKVNLTIVRGDETINIEATLEAAPTD